MNEKLTIYIVGDFKSGAADGLAEFNYQNVKLLENIFQFEFVEFEKERDPGYYVVELRGGINVHRFGTKGLWVFKLPSAFHAWLELLPKDVVFHLSHIWNLTNYLIARKLVKANIPYIITPHDSYVYDRPYNDSRTFIKRFYRHALVQIFDKYVLDHAKIVHALTSQCVPPLQLLTRSNVVVVENQVKDVNIPFSIADIKPQICFVGRVSIYQKGIDLALEAFAGFKRHLDWAGVPFILVGPADQQALESCKSIIKNLALKPDVDVVFTGKISEHDRNSILATSKVYLQLSRYEGFGLSVAQALSAFKPVIVSTGVPIGSVILRHGAGFVVNDAQEAAEAIDKLFRMSENDYQQMAFNARLCYEKEFHPDVIKPLLIALYESTRVR